MKTKLAHKMKDLTTIYNNLGIWFKHLTLQPSQFTISMLISQDKFCMENFKIMIESNANSLLYQEMIGTQLKYERTLMYTYY